MSRPVPEKALPPIEDAMDNCHEGFCVDPEKALSDALLADPLGNLAFIVSCLSEGEKAELVERIARALRLCPIPDHIAPVLAALAGVQGGRDA